MFHLLLFIIISSVRSVFGLENPFTHNNTQLSKSEVKNSPSEFPLYFHQYEQILCTKPNESFFSCLIDNFWVYVLAELHAIDTQLFPENEFMDKKLKKIETKPGNFHFPLKTDEMINFIDSSNTGQDASSARFRRRHRHNMMMPMVIMFGMLAMGMIVVPMGFQFLAVLGGKALLLAKMALLLTAIQGLKKIATSPYNYGLYQATSNPWYPDRKWLYDGSGFEVDVPEKLQDEETRDIFTFLNPKM